MKGKKLTFKEKIKAIYEEPAETRRAYQRLLNHLAEGFSPDTCSPLTEKIVAELCEKWPDIWIAEEIGDAMMRGKLAWESIGRRQADGSCMGNSRSWYYNMSNRYGWSDRQTVDAKVEGSVSVNIVNYSSKKPSQ